ncbi:O-antigen ligase family protein [Planctomycetota bacterium]|nr:O-antigen ligase family protein [Planctomycetota bacterium]
MASSARGLASTTQQKALYATCAAIFLLLVAPRARFDPGGIPIYFYDVVGSLAFGLAYSLPFPSDSYLRRFRALLSALLILILVSQINCGVSFTSPTNAAYMAIRYVTNTLMAVTILKMSARREGFDLMIKTIIIACTFTAITTILVSIPATRGLVSPLLQIPILNPNSEWVGRYLASAPSVVRGESLIGTSTITGAFLASMWPIVACMPFIKVDAKSAWQRLRVPMSGLVALGALMTYSRGALVAVGAACIVFLLRGSQQTRRASAALIVAVCAVAYLAPTDSDNFMVDRYSKRFAILAEGVRAGGEFSSVNEAVRLQSYIDPFTWLASHPRNLVLGVGNSRGNITKGHAEFPTYKAHAVIPNAMMRFGLLSAALFLSIILLAFNAVGSGQRSDGQRSKQAAASIQAMLAAASIWFIVGHAAISTARGYGLTMMMVALALGVRLHLRQGRPTGSVIVRPQGR